jgi:hypothetical protein
VPAASTEPTGNPEQVEELKPPDWGTLILGLIAMFLAEAIASSIGLTPEKAIGALEARHVEGVLDAVLAPDISARLVTWSGFAFAGISSLLVVWAGLQVPKEKSLAASLMTGLVVMASLLLAWVTAGQGILAGATTGLVMFFSALAARQHGTVKALGVAIGTLYFLFAILGITNNVSGSEEALTIVKLSGFGSLVGIGLLIVLHLVNVLTRYQLIADRKPAAHAPSPPIERGSFFARGPGMRYAIARGVLLGIGMGIYQADQNNSVFWAMIAIWVVLQPEGAATWEIALKRGLGILAGCLAIGILSQLVSGETLVWIALGLLLIGLAYYRRSYPIYQTCMSMLVVTIYADTSGEGIIHWALLRILDNAIGIALALLLAYLVFPDRPAKDKSEVPSAS